jgi:hypothetical protein
LRSDGTVERRRAPRRAPAADEPLSQVRLRAGRELVVVDVADGGLLAEGGMRLLPGTHVDVHLVTSEGRLLVRSRVVRAFVCYLASECIRYRGALMFERPVDTAFVGYAIPEALGRAAERQGSAYPDSAAISANVAANPAAT